MNGDLFVGIMIGFTIGFITGGILLIILMSARNIDSEGEEHDNKE
jgi:hypothetical protein